jgi:hypothetical protein
MIEAPERDPGRCDECGDLSVNDLCDACWDERWGFKPHAVHVAQEPACVGCGDAIEGPLARLGSIRCADCRDSSYNAVQAA